MRRLFSIYEISWFRIELINNLYLREPIYTMTVIGDNVFATGDDNGVVKRK